jgi:choline-glycine betaine transporter
MQFTNFVVISVSLYGIVNRLYAKNAYKKILERIHDKFFLNWNYENFQYWAVVTLVWVLATIAVVYSRYGDLYVTLGEFPPEYHDLSLLENTSFMRMFGGNPDNMHWGFQLIDIVMTIAVCVSASGFGNWLEGVFGEEHD